MRYNTYNIGQFHSFSYVLAKKYGVNAALILSYIGFKIQHSQHDHDGKKWFYITIKDLAQHYPYLGCTAVFDALQRLTRKDGPLITGNYNKKKYDRTKWYAFKNNDLAQLLEKEPRYFRVEEAIFHGLAEAVLLSNLAYQITENRKKNPNYRCHPMSPAKLAEIQPFSRSAIQRALKNLVEDKVLLNRSTTDTRLATEYCFADLDEMQECLAGSKANMVFFDDTCVFKEDYEILPAQTQIPNMAGSNPDLAGSIANMAGSNPNDNTH